MLSVAAVLIVRKFSYHLKRFESLLKMLSYSRLKIEFHFHYYCFMRLNHLFSAFIRLYKFMV